MRNKKEVLSIIVSGYWVLILDMSFLVVRVKREICWFVFISGLRNCYWNKEKLDGLWELKRVNLKWMKWEKWEVFYGVGWILVGGRFSFENWLK